MLEKRRTAAGDTAADNKVPGGMPPSNQFRKRLNKSVKWVTKLQAVAKAVAGERLKQELEAYVAEVKGRAAVAHGLMMEAKKHFLEARERYYALKIDSNVEQWALLVTKLTEMDDRVLIACCS
ncbi:putative RNA binding signal recognition particle 68 [Trypanosoma vivax]|nr:putative RNA binding signal recognition particle 68 [Trypanosoma vivax]